MSTGKSEAPSAAPTPERKTCPVCGASFGCTSAQVGACWCAEVQLSAEEAAALRARFTGCLCPRCLSLAVDRGASQQRGEKPAGNPPS